jgi:hypothetical protein
MMNGLPKGRKSGRFFTGNEPTITSSASTVYPQPVANYVAFMGHFLYNLAAFDFRVPSQYKPLRSTQRVTFLQENPESFSATSKKKEIATSWKQEQ